jgi:hypothetical protein
MLLPPCTNTTTGFGPPERAGCHTFRYKQSSEPSVWPRVVPIVASYWLFAPGP